MDNNRASLENQKQSLLLKKRIAELEEENQVETVAQRLFALILMIFLIQRGASGLYQIIVAIFSFLVYQSSLVFQVLTRLVGQLRNQNQDLQKVCVCEITLICFRC